MTSFFWQRRADSAEHGVAAQIREALNDCASFFLGKEISTAKRRNAFGGELAHARGYNAEARRGGSGAEVTSPVSSALC